MTLVQAHRARPEYGQRTLNNQLTKGQTTFFQIRSPGKRGQHGGGEVECAGVTRGHPTPSMHSGENTVFARLAGSGVYQKCHLKLDNIG